MMKITPFLLLLLSIFEISEAGFRDGLYKSLETEGEEQLQQQTESSSTKKEFQRKLAKLVASHRDLHDDDYNDDHAHDDTSEEVEPPTSPSYPTGPPPPTYSSPDYHEESSPDYQDEKSPASSAKSSKDSKSKSSKSSKGSSGKYYSSSDYHSDGDNEGYGHRAGDDHYHGPGTLDFVIMMQEMAYEPMPPPGTSAAPIGTKFAFTGDISTTEDEYGTASGHCTVASEEEDDLTVCDFFMTFHFYEGDGLLAVTGHTDSMDGHFQVTGTGGVLASNTAGGGRVYFDPAGNPVLYVLIELY